MFTDSASSVLSGVYVAPRLHMACANGRGFANDVLGSFAAGAVANFGGSADVCGSFLKSTLTVEGAPSSNNFVMAGNTTVTGTTSVYEGTLGVGTTGAHFVGNITVQGPSMLSI